MSETKYRPCTLCEAHCGLALEVENNRVVKVRGDAQDDFSQGFICPKGASIGELHHDPDRLRMPLVKDANGNFQETDWETALTRAAEGLAKVRDRDGADSVGMYIGNPVIHNYGAIILRSALSKAIGTKNSYSAGSQDTAPRFATSYYLYGTSLTIPIPDLDRTDYFLCIGANPVVSNGSALTAPDMKKRMRAIQKRGGRVVIVDPRRTESARIADEHIPIKPGGDAAFQLALAAILLADGRVDHAAVRNLCDGWPEVRAKLERFDIAAASAECGVPVETMQRIAREFAEADTAAAYSRVGVCNNRHGTLASYATDLLNIVGGRLGEVGGSMFTTPAIDATRPLRMPGMDGHGRWKSRVRGLPETLGDLPSATLADEIETPGDGQIRAMFTFAGNPVLSTPNGKRMNAALESLEFMVSVDIYVNETTRHADVILPPAWTLADEHADPFFSQFTVRNIVGWSGEVVQKGPAEKHDWEILLELTERLGGGPYGEPPLDAGYRIAKRFGFKFKPMQVVDLLLRTGKHGDRYLPWSKGWSVKKLAAHPHGVDLGALEPGVARRVSHKGEKVAIAPKIFLDAIDALHAELTAPPTAKDPDELLAIGRRDLRSNNSWMHNIPSLVSGKERCTVMVHPADAERIGVRDGEHAVMESRHHSGPVPVSVSEDIAPGVVCMPHGWGHQSSARWQRVAGETNGVSLNDWSDDAEVEPLVGQSILNGFKVKLRAMNAGARGDDSAAA